MLPSIKRHAKIAFRYLDPEAKQEAVQNVLPLRDHCAQHGHT